MSNAKACTTGARRCWERAQPYCAVNNERAISVGRGKVYMTYASKPSLEFKYAIYMFGVRIIPEIKFRETSKQFSSSGTGIALEVKFKESKFYILRAWDREDTM